MSKGQKIRWLELHESIPRWVARLIKYKKPLAEDGGANYLKAVGDYKVNFAQILGYMQSQQEHLLLNYLASKNLKITSIDKDFAIDLLTTHCAERWQWSIISYFLFSDKEHYNLVGAELIRYYKAYIETQYHTASAESITFKVAMAGILSDCEDPNL